jgi:hypothetical protein
VTTVPVFIGYDHRQPVSFMTLTHSLIKHSSRPLAITPLVFGTLQVRRVGLTPFTFSRFLVPSLMDYRGWAVFMDIDMLARADIAELLALADDRYAVMVVKNNLKFEWTSLMLLNCERCRVLTPEYIEGADRLHAIGWLPAEEIGDLPAEWNHLVGYDEPDPNAKLAHFTQGVPAYPETLDSEFGEEWRAAAGEAFSSISWRKLMGNSVHAGPVYERLAQKVA